MIPLFIFIFTGPAMFGQHLASPIPDAKKEGIRIEDLDRTYTSAVHSDTSMAVFKTDSAQMALLRAYTGLLQDFGKFLKENNFHWDRPEKGRNRVYFSADGSIDYFLYIFREQNVRPEDQLSPEKKTEFNRLLNLFIRNYKFPLHPGVKFAQCSPVIYMPEADDAH